MTVKKLSPVAEFLRANHAKARNHKVYWSTTGDLVKTCEFFDSNGNYLGKMSRTGAKVGKEPAFAYLRSYIQALELGFKAGDRQLKENAIYFAKVVDKSGKKVMYLPEKMSRKQTVIDTQGIKTIDEFERTINSNLKLIKPAEERYGCVSQNTYQALEPVKYKEVQTNHSVIKSDKF